MKTMNIYKSVVIFCIAIIGIPNEDDGKMKREKNEQKRSKQQRNDKN
jgi:hypothetical protein